MTISSELISAKRRRTTKVPCNCLADVRQKEQQRSRKKGSELTDEHACEHQATPFCFFCRSSWTQTLHGLCDVRLASLHPHQGTRAEVWAAKKRQDTSLFTALLSLPPTAMAIAVAPPTVTMMTMVIVPVVMMAMVIVAVVNRRTKIVLGGGFADWRHRSRVSARHWS
jgi:hypothetical protein